MNIKLSAIALLLSVSFSVEAGRGKQEVVRIDGKTDSIAALTMATVSSRTYSGIGFGLGQSEDKSAVAVSFCRHINPVSAVSVSIGTTSGDDSVTAVGLGINFLF